MRYILPDTVTNVIICPRRAGTTWLQTLLGSYLYVSYNLPKEHLMHLLELTRNLPQVTAITHDPQHESDNPTPVEEEYQGKRIAVLLRNPYDVIVSRYLLDRYRRKLTTLFIAEYARQVVPEVLRFYNLWLTCDRSAFVDYSILRYEDLTRDTRGELARLIAFLGYKVDERGLRRAVEFSSFESMQKMEKTGQYHETYKVSDMLPVDNTEAMRTRRGRIGGYVDYLDSETIQWIDSQTPPSVREIYG